jgi:hypothetical protein
MLFRVMTARMLQTLLSLVTACLSVELVATSYASSQLMSAATEAEFQAA